MKVKDYEIKPCANLYEANLCRANLYRANLREADLYRADLRGANLYGANLYRADLRGANLYGADLREASLYGADLRGADLRGADLRGAEGVPKNVSSQLQVLPDKGDVFGWKKCRGGVIVELLIKSDTPRSSATTRMCRTKEATVLKVIGANVGVSDYDRTFQYREGETVVCDHWEEDRWKECGGGIHFFITRQEAEDY